MIFGWFGDSARTIGGCPADDLGMVQDGFGMFMGRCLLDGFDESGNVVSLLLGRFLNSVSSKT